MGVREAIVDPEMQVGVADRLRADSVVPHPDKKAVSARRRRKSAAELAGIRRAQVAAHAGLRAARRAAARVGARGDRLVRAGEVVTAEVVRACVPRRIPPPERRRTPT